VLSFLDNSVRTLEAVETLADVDGRDDVAEDVQRKRQRLL
jgi:superfamily II helicase